MRLWVTDLDNTLCDTDVLEDDSSRIGELALFENASKVFKALVAQGVPIVVLTKGDFVYQRSKIHQLGLTEVIDELFVADTDAQKAILFKQILDMYKLPPEEIVMIGDRRDSEVAIGKEFGVKTIWFAHGKYNKDQKAPEGVYTAHTYQDILKILSEL